MGAFRTSDGAESLEAPTKDGTLRLELAPRHVGLTVGALAVTVTEGFVSVTDSSRKRPRRWSERLRGAGLVVARDVPREDLGLWLEVEPGAMQRIFGVAPRDLITDDGLDSLRALDRLTARLRLALGQGTRRAHEIGPGADKVLVTDDGEHLVVYARRLFSRIARRVLDVDADGHVAIAHRRGDATFQLSERFGVIVTGDLVRFIDRDGTDLGRLALPWIHPEDRVELARRLGDMIERHVPESEALAHAHATDAHFRRTRLRLIGRLRFRGLRTGW